MKTQAALLVITLFILFIVIREWIKRYKKPIQEPQQNKPLASDRKPDDRMTNARQPFMRSHNNRKKTPGRIFQIVKFKNGMTRNIYHNSAKA